MGIVDTNDELIATDAATDIRVPSAGTEPLGYVPQKLVADAMAMCIIHALEIVEIDERQRQAPFKASVGEPFFDPR
ncbi:hypothetical protein MIC97_21335 [Aquamicrobium sp. NLF2-7]|uniref:hypothetical protein n=1 Tax=Aquamicrobium sp. NLF2-7 TaxID=2918753 RepID=UPI001EFB20F8|nr:hypothetical protein [Aquamicrobium sp. NLF2-7]MCG8274031.1 hypothetical protein [Aquamicrobium sp. NLF2-7]